MADTGSGSRLPPQALWVSVDPCSNEQEYGQLHSNIRENSWDATLGASSCPTEPVVSLPSSKSQRLHLYCQSSDQLRKTNVQIALYRTRLFTEHQVGAWVKTYLADVDQCADHQMSLREETIIIPSAPGKYRFIWWVTCTIQHKRQCET